MRQKNTLCIDKKVNSLRKDNNYKCTKHQGPKTYKANIEKLKREIDSTTIISGDLNTFNNGKNNWKEK